MHLDSTTSSQFSNFDGIVIEIYYWTKTELVQGGFELQTSYIQCRYLAHFTLT